jgi:biopolymer transport protein ExbD
MQVARRKTPRALISLTPLIDVMLILLVFFMVTSTYLDLDMMPMVQAADDPGPAATSGEAGNRPLLLRLDKAGDVFLRGQVVPAGDLVAFFGRLRRADTAVQLLVLPSGAASTQSLVRLIDAATAAGVENLRIIRPEVSP